MNSRSRIFVAEAIGTLVLVLGGCGSAVLAGKQIGYLGVSLAFGLSLLVMSYAIGGISGCHINPAVTVSLAFANKLKKSLVPIYIGAQVVGAILGAGILYAIASGKPGFNVSAGFATNGYGAHSPEGYGLFAAALTEIVLTFFLIITVMATTHPKYIPSGFASIPIGLVLVLIHLVGIPVTNTSVNPARSIGVAIFQGGWALQQLWLFLLAPIVGGILGVVVYNIISSDNN